MDKDVDKQESMFYKSWGLDLDSARDTPSCVAN